MNLTESQHTGCGVNAMAAKTIALPASQFPCHCIYIACRVK